MMVPFVENGFIVGFGIDTSCSTFVDSWLIGTDIMSIERDSDAWKMM